MELERRMIETETREDDEGGITGTAAVFYDDTEATEFKLWDGVVERIMPGAFTGIRKADVRALFNHNPDNMLGRTGAKTLKLTVTDRGLDYQISPGDTQIGRDVREHIRRGDVTGSSFGFRVVDERWRKEDDLEIREVRRVEVIDVGPVTFPAYQATNVQARDIAKASHDAWAMHEVEEQDKMERRRQRIALEKRTHVRKLELDALEKL